jgi:hypothetical protein
MNFVRSDTPEVVRGIDSASVRANRRFPAFIYGCSLTILILLIAIAVSLIISVRAAAWFGVPVFLAENVYLLWLTKASRRNWVIAASAERVYVRLFMACGSEPHVIVLEASEIASMSIKTVEVFVYGPKPEFAEWLVIEPAQAIEEIVPSHFLSFLEDIWTHDSGNLVRVGILEGRLTIGWKLCHPALRVFLQQVVRECPSVVIAPEEHSELDLNGIWQYGRLEKPNAQQRQMLVQAKRLGFGGECAQRLSQYKHMSSRKASAYLAEIVQEEAGAGHDPKPPDYFTMHYPHL